MSRQASTIYSRPTISFSTKSQESSLLWQCEARWTNSVPWLAPCIRKTSWIGFSVDSVLGSSPKPCDARRLHASTDDWSPGSARTVISEQAAYGNDGRNGSWPLASARHHCRRASAAGISHHVRCQRLAPALHGTRLRDALQAPHRGGACRYQLVPTGAAVRPGRQELETGRTDCSWRGCSGTSMFSVEASQGNVLGPGRHGFRSRWQGF